METKSNTVNTTEELTQLSSKELLLKLDEVRQKCLELGYKKVEAHKRFKDFKELKESTLSAIRKVYMAMGKSTIEAKIFAEADDQYKEWLRLMNEAEEEALALELEHKAWVKSLEVLTSIGYVRNQEMKLHMGR